jgi:cytochrome P450
VAAAPAGLAAAPPGAPVAAHFDHNSLAYGRERFDWFRAIREEHGPVVWSPHYGGFWVVLGRDELVEAAKEWATFSSSGDLPDGAGGSRHNGLFLPPRPQAIPLLESDPPQWDVLRKALNPIFLPGEVARWRGRIQELVDACIDERIESGTIDIAADLNDVVPVLFTLDFVGVTFADFRRLAKVHNLSSHIAGDDPRWPEVAAALEGEVAVVALEIERRRALPAGQRGPGMIARLLDARDEGADIATETMLQLCMLTLGAGIDTTAAVLGTSLAMISRDPELRRRLQAEPDLIRPAFHEFLRLATPTSGLSRTAMRDTVLGGQQIRKGDRVMLCFAAASRDPREFPEPDTFRFDRRANRHTGFGSGIHRCLGAHYAELEFEIVLSSILRRMPDFVVDEAGMRKYDNIGIVDGWIAIPATFTPGQRLRADSILPG